MTLFSKRHYIALAKHYNAQLSLCERLKDRLILTESLHCLADMLQADNPSFNRQKFVSAATPTLPPSQILK